MWGGIDATHAHVGYGLGPSLREMVALGRGAGASVGRNCERGGGSRVKARRKRRTKEKMTLIEALSYVASRAAGPRENASRERRGTRQKVFTDA